MSSIIGYWFEAKPVIQLVHVRAEYVACLVLYRLCSSTRFQVEYGRTAIMSDSLQTFSYL